MLVFCFLVRFVLIFFCFVSAVGSVQAFCYAKTLKVKYLEKQNIKIAKVFIIFWRKFMINSIRSCILFHVWSFHFSLIQLNIIYFAIFLYFFVFRFAFTIASHRSVADKPSRMGRETEMKRKKQSEFMIICSSSFHFLCPSRPW